MDRECISQAVGTIFFFIWGWLFMEACFSDEIGWFFLVFLLIYPMDAIVKWIAGDQGPRRGSGRSSGPQANPFDADGG